MQPFNTSNYNIQRKEDNSLVRVDGLGGETPEMTVDYYTQVLANLEAQKSKVEQFELENPAPVVEEPQES